MGLACPYATIGLFSWNITILYYIAKNGEVVDHMVDSVPHHLISHHLWLKHSARTAHNLNQSLSDVVTNYIQSSCPSCPEPYSFELGLPFRRREVLFCLCPPSEWPAASCLWKMLLIFGLLDVYICSVGKFVQ